MPIAAPWHDKIASFADGGLEVLTDSIAAFTRGAVVHRTITVVTKITDTTTLKKRTVIGRSLQATFCSIFLLIPVAQDFSCDGVKGSSERFSDGMQ